MSLENPYSPPLAENPFADKAASDAGIWRDGNILVMHRDAQLPDRCIKSNEPSNGQTLKRKLTWHHPAVFLALLANLIIYAILATVLGKRATIYIGLSPKWFAKRRRRMLVSWILVFVFVGTLFAPFALEQQVGSDATPLFIMIGVLGTLFAAIYGLISCRLVHPKKITDEHIWLKGASPDYLAALPPWPYE